MLSKPSLLLIPCGRGRPRSKGCPGLCVPAFKVPLPVETKPLCRLSIVGGVEKSGLGFYTQGDDSVVEGGKMGVYKNSSARLGSGGRLLGVVSWGSVTLGKWLKLSEPHFPHL